MKVLNFGSCNIDYVYSLDHIVREGETEEDSDSLRVIISDIVSRIVRANTDITSVESDIRKLDYDLSNTVGTLNEQGNSINEVKERLGAIEQTANEDFPNLEEKVENHIDKDFQSLKTDVENLETDVEELRDIAFHDVSYDPATGKLSFKTQTDNEQFVNLPLEMVVSSGRFDDLYQDLILVLNNGSEIRIPLDALSDKIASDIVEIKEKLDAAFMDVRLDGQKLIFTWQDNGEKDVDLSGFAHDDEARTAIKDLTDRVNTLEEAQGDLSTVLEQLNEGGIE